MGRGKKIQDFRKLNLESSVEYKKNNRNSSIIEKEFIIEVEEKNKKDHVSNDKKNNITKKKKSIKQHKSPKTYIEEEAEKKKKEKRKNTSIVVSAFLLIFICIGVIAGCLTTPTFDVSYIDVADGNNVTAAEINRFFSNVRGKNIFLINLNELEQEIQKQPYIYKADITRNLPKTLSVKYIERKPYAIIKYIESYVLIDKYGSVLEIKKENDMPGLPIIYGVESNEFIPGQELAGVANLKFENTVYLLETAKHVNFGYTISEINYTDSEEVRIILDELNVQIIYGSIEREILNDKITYLGKIIKELGDKKGLLDISSANYSEKVIFTEILK